MLRAPAPDGLLDDLLATGLKWSITVWAETAKLRQARDEAITAVRDALARDGVEGPRQVTTVRLLDRAADHSTSHAA